MQINAAERCDHLQERFDIVGRPDSSGDNKVDVFRQCLRPSGHEGPHLIIDHRGRYVAWEDDTECDCHRCRSEDPNDRCLIYWELSEQDGRWLQHSLRPIYLGTPEEWLACGDEVLSSLPLAVRRESLCQYFYCNVQDKTYVIAPDYCSASRAYAAEHHLFSEGWPMYGVIIQEHHLD